MPHNSAHAPHFSSLELLAPFPPTRYAFAYGSAALPQAFAASTPLKDSMLDLILAVDDPVLWHTENLQRNRDHYSWLARSTGAASIGQIQESNFGARMWYNALVTLPSGRLIKYGVISSRALSSDLTEWNNLYASGRLHKPVADLQQPSTLLTAAMLYNRRAALRASLLLLPAQFTLRDFFRTLVTLSYGGDWRMTFGESPKKIDNIVDGAPHSFAQVYETIFASHQKFVTLHGSVSDLSTICKQDKSMKTQIHLGQTLPLSVQKGIATRAAKEDLYNNKDIIGDDEENINIKATSTTGSGRGGDGGDDAIEIQIRSAASTDVAIQSFWSTLAAAQRRVGSNDSNTHHLAQLLKPTLSAIVAPAAAGQAIIGILTAGPEKATKYAAAKLKKVFKLITRH